MNRAIIAVRGPSCLRNLWQTWSKSLQKGRKSDIIFFKKHITKVTSNLWPLRSNHCSLPSVVRSISFDPFAYSIPNLEQGLPLKSRWFLLIFSAESFQLMIKNIQAYLDPPLETVNEVLLSQRNTLYFDSLHAKLNFLNVLYAYRTDYNVI